MLTDANGKPYVEQIANAFLQASGFTLNQPNSALIIAQLDADLMGYLLDGDDSTNRNTIFVAGDDWAIFAGTANVTGNATDTDRHLHGALFDGASSEIREDGASVASGNPGSAGLDAIRVGKRYTLGGDGTGNRFQEIVIWNSDLGADFATAEANMNAYWAIY